jgi:hypothetical protein
MLRPFDALAVNPDKDVPKRPVVHVHAPCEIYVVGIDIEFVAPENMIVYHCRKEIVGSRYRMEVARKMEVDVIHRHYLRVSAACGAALKPENRPERGFPEGKARFFAYF